MTGSVYALVDPRDRAIRYVGKTVKTIERRRIEHVQASRRGRTYTAAWIRSLTTIGLTPEVRLLEVVRTGGIPALNRAEISWIAHYRRHGARLTNHTNGGDGGDTWSGRKHTPKTKAFISAVNKKAANPKRARRIAESKRRQYQDPEYRAKMKAAGLSGTEAARLITTGRPGRIPTDEERDRISKSLKGQTISPETRAKISKALKGTGKTHPPGWSEKVRATKARKRLEAEGGDSNGPFVG